MVTYCSACGSELREEARYCDRCGSRVGGDGPDANSPRTYDVRTNDVVRSAKIVVSQQRLFSAIGSIFGGLLFLVLAAVGMGGSFAGSFLLIVGFGMIILGVAYYVLGAREQEKY